MRVLSFDRAELRCFLGIGISSAEHLPYLYIVAGLDADKAVGCSRSSLYQVYPSYVH